MNKDKVFTGYDEKPIIPKDINGIKIKPGQKVICLESYNNQMHNGTVLGFTEFRIKVKLEKLSWFRYVMPENAERMLYVKPESNEQFNRNIRKN